MRLVQVVVAVVEAVAAVVAEVVVAVVDHLQNLGQPKRMAANQLKRVSVMLSRRSPREGK